jgi:hypothetical protein
MGREAQESVGARITHLSLYCIAAGLTSLVALASALLFISAKNKLAADNRMLVTFFGQKKINLTLTLFRHLSAEHFQRAHSAAIPLISNRLDTLEYGCTNPPVVCAAPSRRRR